MPWVYRQAAQHECEKPKHVKGDRVRTGDIWQCDECSLQYQVKVEFDQREPGNWFTWTLLGGGELKV